MNANFSWQLDPVKSLDQLSSGLRNKAMRIAINAGAAPVKAAIVSAAPSETGNLKKAMRIKVKNYKSNNTWVAVIGASTSFKRTKGRGKKKKVVKPSRYQHLVDQGTKHSKGAHFIDAAFNASKTQYVAGVMRKLSELIPQLMAQNTK